MVDPSNILYPSTSLFPGGLTEGPFVEFNATPRPVGVTNPNPLTQSSEALDLQNLRDYATANLNEEFSDRQGRLPRYYPYEEDDRIFLNNQRHVDIRSLVDTTSRTVRLTIAGYSNYNVGSLSTQTMAQLQNFVILTAPSENWSTGTIALDPVRKNWRILGIPVTAGDTIANSVIVSDNQIVNMDIDAGFDDADYISVALPSFPKNSLVMANTYLCLTSNPLGIFSDGPTANIPFSSSLTTLIQGDSEFRVTRGAIKQINPNVNLSAITGVRLILNATGSATVKVAGIRLLSKSWTYVREDLNTYFGEFQNVVSLTGNPATPYAHNRPIYWRSGVVPNVEDPRPINADIGTLLFTGSMTNTNQVSLYFREARADLYQQIDLNGKTMSQLDGQEQPDLGVGGFDTRPQNDFDSLSQTDIDKKTQFELERIPDPLSASWIEFNCIWSPTDTSFSIRNTERGGYSFQLGSALTPNSNYILISTLEDSSVRMRLYPISSLGEILTDQIVFDSTLIEDSYVYKRRKGRFGWFATLNDGDAAIRSIRERGVSYAEYRTLPYTSRTPVNGLQVIAENTNNFELFSDFIVTDDSILLSRSEADQIWQVDNPIGHIGQGVRTNQFVIGDFSQTEVSFDIFYPGSPTGLDFLLISADGYRIELTAPAIRPNIWQPMRLTTPFDERALTGPYRLVILQNEVSARSWRIRNVSVFKRAVSWYARPIDRDSASQPEAWLPFRSLVNVGNGGVLFHRPSTQFQVQGLGHFEGATIDRLQFIPRYATLGRFAWPEDLLLNPRIPGAQFSSSNTGRAYTFTSTIADPENEIIQWYWTITDGASSFGPMISHVFERAGTYGVTLTAINRFGRSRTTTASISVS
jgi:hypothetical protein